MKAAAGVRPESVRAGPAWAGSGRKRKFGISKWGEKMAITCSLHCGVTACSAVQICQNVAKVDQFSRCNARFSPRFALQKIKKKCIVFMLCTLGD
jgi:hypothetical protein